MPTYLDILRKLESEPPARQPYVLPDAPENVLPEEEKQTQADLLKKEYEQLVAHSFSART